MQLLSNQKNFKIPVVFCEFNNSFEKHYLSMLHTFRKSLRGPLYSQKRFFFLLKIKRRFGSIKVVHWGIPRSVTRRS